MYIINVRKQFDSFLAYFSYAKQSERKIQNKNMISSILHERWLGKVVAERDCVRILNAFEHYPAWILLLRDETLVQETKYLASRFCCFSGIMLRRNSEYLPFCEVLTANSYSETLTTVSFKTDCNINKDDTYIFRAILI